MRADLQNFILTPAPADAFGHLTVGARPSETFHKKPNPETPGRPATWCGNGTLSMAKPSRPKKPRAPWRQAG
eukprot:3683929-Pyramimonas_sp.AAC.3